MSYKVGDFFIRNDNTPEDGALFMVYNFRINISNHNPGTRYEIIGFSVVDGRLLNYFWESDESLNGDFIPHYPSDEEKAFFLLKLENTKNE